MAKSQSASLERKKLLADPILCTTIVLLVVFLTVFILYPLAILLVVASFQIMELQLIFSKG